MADQQQSAGLLGLPISVWVALILSVAGIFALTQNPFQNTRPPSVVIPLTQRPLGDGQNVEARLWEDPLSAVTLARKGNEPPAPYEPRALQTRIQQNKDANSKTLVLGVMINGAPFTDDIETRRRARYAVLAGLYRSGFIPANHDHIGFIFTERTVEVAAFGQHSDHSATTHNIAAFEWFKRDNAVISPRITPASDQTPASHSNEASQTGPTSEADELSQSDRVLVLWLDQEGFRNLPIRELSEILQTIVGREDPLVTLAILGPADSDGLRAIYDEVQRAARGEVWPPDLLPMSF